MAVASAELRRTSALTGSTKVDSSATDNNKKVSTLFDLYFPGREEPYTRIMEVATGSELRRKANEISIPAKELGIRTGIAHYPLMNIFAGLYRSERMNGQPQLIANELGVDLTKLDVEKYLRTFREFGRLEDDFGYRYLTKILEVDARSNPRRYEEGFELGVGVRYKRWIPNRLGRERLAKETGISFRYISWLEHGTVPEEALDWRVDRIAEGLRLTRLELQLKGESILERISLGDWRGDYRNDLIKKVKDYIDLHSR